MKATALRTDTRGKRTPESEFLHLFFDFLNSEKIEYVVIRNYESLPEKVSGTDIDLVVRNHHYDLCRDGLAMIAGNVHYRKWKEYPKNYDIIQMSFVPVKIQDPQDVIRIDFIQDNVKWMGFCLIDEKFLWDCRVKYNDIWILAEPAKTTLTLLNTFLHGGQLKDKYILDYNYQSSMNKEIIDKGLDNILGDEAKSVIAMLRQGKAGDVALRKIRCNFLKSQNLNIAAIVTGLYMWVRVAFSRLLFPPGLFVAFVGPDGCGKSTVCEMVMNQCKRMFPGINHFHLFPKVGFFRAIDKVSNHRWSERQEKGTEWERRNEHYGLGKSLLRCFYLLIRFWTGYLFKIYPELMKGNLVIGERWNYDILFDPASKGISLPYWFRRTIFSLCPPPQKTIVLMAEAEEITSRKPELPEREIARQIALINQLLANKKGVCYENTSTSTDKTFQRVLVRIVG